MSMLKFRKINTFLNKKLYIVYTYVILSPIIVNILKFSCEETV